MVQLDLFVWGRYSFTWISLDTLGLDPFLLTKLSYYNIRELAAVSTLNFDFSATFSWGNDVHGGHNGSYSRCVFSKEEVDTTLVYTMYLVSGN